VTNDSANRRNMNLSIQQNRPIPANEAPHKRSSDATSPILRIALALALITTAANCFLKYLWWTACYSAWAGIPKLVPQWRAAGDRSSFYGWTVIVLELATLILLYTVISLRQVTFSTFLRTALRLVASLTLTVLGTGCLALVWSWVKQSH
jgi:hypothetical protein